MFTDFNCAIKNALGFLSLPCQTKSQLLHIKSEALITFQPKTCASGCTYHDATHSCDCGLCFPSTARVSLENGKLVTMGELQIGDQVQTGRVISNLYLKEYTEKRSLT